MNHVHAIIPMAGEGARFATTGGDLPKPLVPLQGRPFLYWSAAALLKSLPLASLTFVVLRRHIDEHAIDTVIHAFFPKARLVVLDAVLNGPVMTCLAGVRDLDDDLPVLFNDCDHLFHSQALVRWIASGKGLAPDQGGSLASFPANNPAYSYLCESSPGLVESTIEKLVVSRHAICGAYLFRNRSVFSAAAASYLADCPYGEFFMSGLYNTLIGQGLAVNHLPLDLHLSFGTPDELAMVVDNGLFSHFRDQ